MIICHLIAVTLAFIIDSVIGDPPGWPHPVRWIGSMIAWFEKLLNKGAGRKQKGLLMLFLVLFIVMAITGLIITVCYWVHPLAGILAEALIISAAVARKSLREAAVEVYDPLEYGDLAKARKKLSYIVGRDTDGLEQPEIVRGAVETVAENTSDGVTAPLFWGFAGGAVLAMAYRAVNTCDSMVGYRNERYHQFGWASARLDDLVNWIPSRLTALMMLISSRPRAGSFSGCLSVVLRDARKHPSPNSGWGEASAAALMGVQLGGINYYKGVVSNRAKMGDPFFPLEKRHIKDAIGIMNRAALAFLLLLWLGGMIFELSAAWIKSSLFI